MPRLPPLLAGLLLIIPAAMVLADHTITAVNVTPLLLTNQTGADATAVAAPFQLSGQSLVDGGFLESDMLNSAVEEAETQVPHMPASLSLELERAWNNAGVEETAETNNAAASDMTLPAANGEVYEFGLHHASRIIRLNLGTVGIADWTVTWEYYQKSSGSYVALTGVSDGSAGFTAGPVSNIAWDVPSDWEEAALHGQTAYWVRARVSAFTSLATAPLGTQAWHETGRWRVFSEAISDGEQRSYDLFTGGADLSAFHYYFPGDGGITTTNYAGRLAPDNGIESFEVKGWIDTADVGADIIHKPGAFRVWVSAANEISAQVSGTAVSSFTATTDDGILLKADFTPSYAGAHDAAVADSFGSGGVTLFSGQNFPSGVAYQVDRALVPFETSSLPDDTNIREVRLRVAGGPDYGTASAPLVVQDGAAAGAPPFTAADYSKLLYPGPRLATFQVTGATGASGLYHNVELAGNTVTTTGTTVFVLRGEGDFDNVAPVSDEMWSLDSAESATPPILEVVHDGAETVSAAGIVPGEYTLRVRHDWLDAGTLALDLDGVEQASTVTTTAITGNSSAWGLLRDGSVIYSESVTASMVANRILTPSFEPSLVHWIPEIDVQVTGTVERTTEASVFGEASARINAVSATAPGNALIRYKENAGSGETYQAGLWTYYATGSAALNLELSCRDGAGALVGSADTVTLAAATSWSRTPLGPITCGATTTEAWVRAILNLDPATEHGRAYIDGVALQETSEINRLDLEYQLTAPPGAACGPVCFPDTSGNGFNSTAFDLPAAPSGYLQTILPTGPANPAIGIEPTASITGAVASVGPIANFTEPDTGSAVQLPVLRDVVDVVEDIGYPAEIILVPLGIFLCILAAIAGVRIFNSIWMSYVFVMFTMACLWQWGGWPYYPMIMFAFPGLVFCWWKRERAG